MKTFALVALGVRGIPPDRACSKLLCLPLAIVGTE